MKPIGEHSKEIPFETKKSRKGPSILFIHSSSPYLKILLLTHKLFSSPSHSHSHIRCRIIFKVNSGSLLCRRRTKVTICLSPTRALVNITLLRLCLFSGTCTWLLTLKYFLSGTLYRMHFSHSHSRTELRVRECVNVCRR